MTEHIEDKSHPDDRVLTTSDLISLNARSIRKGYNRVLDPDALEQLADKNGLHLLHRWLVHEHKAGQPTAPHWRCEVLIKQHGTQVPDIAWLDVDMADFDKLMTVETAKAVVGLVTDARH